MKVLFICKSSVGRSQMAAALFNKLSSAHAADSAGYDVGEKAGQSLHEMVFKSMGEKSHDLSKNTRRQLTKDIASQADYVVVMHNTGDKLPDFLTSSNVEYWDIKDPKGSDLETHRIVRDQIEQRVRELITKLDDAN
jgi:protein-tyrosine-phosphatase